MVLESRSAVRRIAVARVVSITGGVAAYTALMYEIYHRTGSAAWLSITLLLSIGLTGMIAPIAGVLGDRFDRRRVMIGSDLAGAACYAALSFAHAPWVMLTLATGAGLAEAPFFGASSAAIPNLIADPALLGWANGLVSMGTNAGILFGPVIGGVLVAWIGPQPVFAINAVSFVASAALIATVRAPFSAERDAAAGQGGWVRAGVAFLARDRVLRTITLAWVAVVLGGGLGMVADAPMARLMGKGALGYGLIIASWGAGSLLGSFTGRYITEGTERRTLIAGAALMAVGDTAMGLSPWFVLILVGVLVAGFGDAATGVATENTLQRRTPDELRSRVTAASDAAVHLAAAVSFAAAGVAVSTLGPRGAYLIGGATAAVAVVTLLSLGPFGSAKGPVQTGPVHGDEAGERRVHI